MIRQTISFLTDNYGWKGSCRCTFFVPNQKSDRIEIYERIRSGRGPGGFKEGKCFFRMNQGIPGRAWANAWTGERDENLIKAIQIGIVPENVLKTKDDKELKKFFKENFGIIDDDIYGSLSDDRFTIRSYMAIGIYGRQGTLIGILCIDSDDPEKFTDFEQLKQKQCGGTVEKRMGLAVYRERNVDCKIPNLVAQETSLQRDITKKIQEAGLVGKKEAFKEIALMLRSIEFTKVQLHVPSFLFPLSWSMKQIRDMFLTTDT